MIMITTTIDIERLKRAFSVKVVRLPDGWLCNAWMVSERHGCSCPDKSIRAVPRCKHEAAVELSNLSTPLLAALREVVCEGEP